MGQITGDLLDAMRVPWEPFPSDPDAVRPALDRAEAAMAGSGRPYAFVMAKGTVEPYPLRRRGSQRSTPRAGHAARARSPVRSPTGWRALEAIRIVRDAVGEEAALLGTTGKIGRELYTLGHRPNQLYVVGSMGCASGMALGVHLGADGRRPVVVLDGDGAALMKMGTLATIGTAAPRRFVHVIIDNEAHESTGGPGDGVGRDRLRNHRRRLRLPQRLARRLARRRSTQPSPRPSSCEGPNLVHVKVAIGSAADLGRPGLAPDRGQGAVHGVVRRLTAQPVQPFHNPVRIRLRRWGARRGRRCRGWSADVRCSPPRAWLPAGRSADVEQILGSTDGPARSRGSSRIRRSHRARPRSNRSGMPDPRCSSPSAGAARSTPPRRSRRRSRSGSAGGLALRHLRDGVPFPRTPSPPPIIAIPTTAGTGSEVTMWATIWDEQTGRQALDLASVALSGGGHPRSRR